MALMSSSIMSKEVHSDSPPPSRESVRLKRTAQFELDQVKGLAFSPSGGVLAAVTVNGQVQIRSRDGAFIKELSLPRISSLTLTSQNLVFSRDGKYLASCFGATSGRTVIRVWETVAWTLVRDIQNDIVGTSCRAIAFSHDGTQLIGAFHRLPQNKGSSLISYSTSTWEKVHELVTGPFYIHLLQVAPDGKRAAIAGAISNVVRWRLPGTPPTFGDPPLPDTHAIALVDLSTWRITKVVQNVSTVLTFSSLVWLPNSTLIGSAGGIGFSFTDADSGISREVEKSRNIDVHTVLATSPDGSMIGEGIMATEINRFALWDRSRTRLLYQAEQPTSAIAFGSDGRTIAAADNRHVTLYFIEN